METSQKINKLITETNIICAQLKLEVLKKNYSLIDYQNKNLISTSLVSEQWNAYQIPETSVHFVITGAGGSKYRWFDIINEETKSSELYNHLYITDEMWKLLDKSTSTWYRLIPGNSEEFQYTARILTADKCKKLIPSYSLFMFRQSLLKATANESISAFSDVKIADK